MKYRPRSDDENRTTVHFGQRKLFLSELEFLTRFSKELECDLTGNEELKVVLIYAGAAPCCHISMLADMFPFVKFVLIDPAEFNIGDALNNKMVETRREYFTDDMAKEMRIKYADYIRLFVSDIRVFGPGSTNNEKLEEKVEEDMVAQERWYKLLEPKLTMLKFRLPYVGEEKDRKTKMEYLDGDVYFQVWPAGLSSETRKYVCC